MIVVSTTSNALADFGARSILTHALMAVGFVGAVLAGLFFEGQLGLVSMVALINFTAGLWIAQSIHSLGNAAAESDYRGVIREVRDRVS